MNGVEMTHAILPQAVLLPMWVKLSWAMVISAVVLRLTYRVKPTVWPAICVAVIMLLPIAGGVSGYLALAFQTPSLVWVAWAAVCWVGVVQRREVASAVPPQVAWFGVLLGWALVVDTLNYWPAFFNPQLYAMGFESMGLYAALALTAVTLFAAQVSQRWVLICVSVLAAYVIFRLPTGNVWDALLDPFVWIALHVQLWCRWRASAAG